MKQFDIKDLLDPEKMKEHNKEIRKLKRNGTAEEVINMSKKNKDNFQKLNQLNQEGKTFPTWGVPPKE
jgi:hypothetical protein